MIQDIVNVHEITVVTFKNDKILQYTIQDIVNRMKL